VSQQINLFNPIFLKQKKVFTAVAMARALALLLAGVALLAFYASENVATLEREAALGRQLLAEREQRLVKVKAEFSPRARSAALEAELGEAETRLKALHQVASVLGRGELGNTTGFAEHFKALARQNIAGVWLTGVSIAGAGSELGVQGRALDAALVPVYLGRLTREQVMRGKAFGSLKIGQPAAAKDAAAPPFVEFSLESTEAEAAK
jgi:hypothetical protein